MKKVILFFLLGLSGITTSCSRDKEVIQIAKKYVVDTICPLLKNAELSQKSSSMQKEKVNLINDDLQAVKFYTASIKYLLDRKKIDESLIGQEPFNIEAFKNALIIHEIISSSANAIKQGNTNEGFYVVWTTIKYDENKYENFDIIVSKDLKILNKPVDLNKINKIVKEVAF